MNYFNYFSSEENNIVSRILGECITEILVYTIEYQNSFQVIGYVQIVFQNMTEIILTTGKYADNIVLLSKQEFKQEISNYKHKDNLTEVKIQSIYKSFEETNHFLNVVCIQKPDEDYYWELYLKFDHFEIKIKALIDEISYELSPQNS